MSWWDYGYQITAIANRTVLVDNNTWNNTHIGRVGQAMASREEDAYEILRELDVDYILVIFGGASSYSSDGTVLLKTNFLYPHQAQCGPFFIITGVATVILHVKTCQGILFWLNYYLAFRELI